MRKYSKWLILIGSLLLLTIYLRYRINDPCQAFGATCICQLDNQKLELVMSFDDGPDSSITPPLLLLLEKLEVQALFFVNGNKLEQNPAIAKQIVERGHILGNHSYQHEDMTFKSFQFIENDMLKTDSLIRLAGQEDIPFYRPPYGKSFINLSRVLNNYNKQMINWSIAAPMQFNTQIDKIQLTEETINELTPGAIILLHDGFPYQNSKDFVGAVELIIRIAREQGYRFVIPKMN